MERMGNQRQFPKLTGVIIFLVVVGTLSGAAWQDQPYRAADQAAASSKQSRAGVWTQATLADFRSGQLLALTARESPDGLALDSGAHIGSYMSAPQRADFSFNGVAVTWKANLPLGANLALEIRTSVDGANWSNWVRMNVVDQFAGYDMNVSDLLLVHGGYLQYRATMTRNESGLSPELREVTLTYIDAIG